MLLLLKRNILRLSGSFPVLSVHSYPLSTMGPKLLSQAEATAIDQELFDEYKFSVDQLMELAGLSCAHAVVKCFPKCNRVLVCCGPGNNGGDGLVCARHLSIMGRDPLIYYPKRTDRPLYHNLVTQCTKMGLRFTDAVPSQAEMDGFDVVVDALFGFSFKPPVRPEFAEVMQRLCGTTAAVASVDVPSGWHVEDGDVAGNGIAPRLLISLTAPKRCAQHFKGQFHFLGGRFVPKPMQLKYGLDLPEYEGTESCVKL